MKKKTNMSETDTHPGSKPFFILGCVRSGTTMLRNILRKHPHLACPEETHFFRWAEPFRGPVYSQIVSSNVTLKKHRQMDGVSDTEFAALLAGSTSRGDLCRQYMALYMRKAKPSATRWFDKSPQNAYGVGILANEFPGGKFVHIVRNPVNVVASLRIGKVMKVEDLVGACSYWNEAEANLALLKRAYPARVLELSYEDFTADPGTGIQKVLEFVGEPYDASWFSDVVTQEVSHDKSGVLSADEMRQVRHICRAGRLRHGYADPADEDDRLALEAVARRERKAVKAKLARQALAMPGKSRAVSPSGKPRVKAKPAPT